MRCLPRVACLCALFTLAACDRATPGGATGRPAAATPPASTPSPATPSPAAAEPAAAPPASHAASGPPVIDFETTRINFGVVPEIEDRSTTVRFTNRGGAELVIEAVKTDCGCTAAEPRKRRYAPGESGILDVAFDPSGAGEQNKNITVFTNAGTTVIEVHAVVEPFAEMEPAILNVGPLALGEPHTFETMLSCPDPDFVVESVTATNPHVSARALPHEPGRPCVIEIVVADTAQWGNLFSWIAAEVRARPRTDADPVTHTTRARLQGQVFGKLAADPDTFRFGVKMGEPFERTITLTRTDGEPFEVVFADAYNLENLPEASLERRHVSPERWDLVLTARGGAVPAPTRGRVIVETDVPGEEHLVINVVGVTRDRYGR